MIVHFLYNTNTYIGLNIYDINCGIIIQFKLLEEMSKKPCSEDRTHSRKYQVMKKNRYKDKYPCKLRTYICTPIYK